MLCSTADLAIDCEVETPFGPFTPQRSHLTSAERSHNTMHPWIKTPFPPRCRSSTAFPFQHREVCTCFKGEKPPRWKTSKVFPRWKTSTNQGAEHVECYPGCLGAGHHQLCWLYSLTDVHGLSKNALRAWHYMTWLFFFLTTISWLVSTCFKSQNYGKVLELFIFSND